MTRGKIIYLNGVTSSGKTSIVEALRKEGVDFYYLSDDVFEDNIIDVEYDAFSVCHSKENEPPKSPTTVLTVWGFVYTLSRCAAAAFLCMKRSEIKSCKKNRKY